MSYESIIGKAMFGQESPESAGQASGLLYAVQRKMFCPHCSCVLDVRRAVLVESPDIYPDKGRAVVTCATCYDRTASNCEENMVSDFTAIGGTITDGRVLHARKLV